jgi:hypothetical protein
MTGDSYARSGGVREAIRTTAERAFAALSAEDQHAARQLFLRLVTPGEGQEDTRARAAMPAEPAQRKIVEQFADPRTRLLVTGSDYAQRPTVEVAHEALIRTWPRLRGWIDANREKLRVRAAVLQAKADWEQSGKRDDMLLPGGLQLERARSLLADPSDITTDDIKEFIGESERRTRKFAPLVLPLLLVASIVVLWGPGFIVFPDPILYLLALAIISHAITCGFGYWRYAGLTLRLTILYGVVYAVVGFATAYEIMTTAERSGFDWLYVWRWWPVTFGAGVQLVISAIFVPLMRRTSVWLPLLVVGNVPYLLWLYYTRRMPMAPLAPMAEVTAEFVDVYVAILWMAVLGFKLRRGAT